MGSREWLLCFILLCVGGVNGETKYAETGKSYTLKPNVQGNIENILWKYSKDKLVEFEGGVLDWYLFKGRGDLNTKTGDLTLKELKKEDSGQYQSEIQVKGQLQYSYHNLSVIDPVPEPKVTCSVDNEGSKTLMCSVPKQASFTWNGPNDLKQPGETINIPKEQPNETVYFCIAANEVSENSTQFTLQDCFAESKTDLVSIIVPVVVVAVVILIILMGVLYKFWDRIRNYLPVANK